MDYLGGIILTHEEMQRLNNIEQSVQKLQTLVSNVGSKNMLNQLHVLVQESVRKMSSRVSKLEEKVEELITEVNKII